MHRTTAGRAVRHGLAGAPGRPRRSGPACRPAAGTRGRPGRPRRAAAPRPRPAPAAQPGRRPARATAQSADRLLQQPQAHDVAQVPDGAVDAGLVGEVRPPGSPRSAPAGPAPRRPATRCRRRCRRSPGPAAGTAGHGRRGVVRADRDHRQRRAASPAGARPAASAAVADDARRAGAAAGTARRAGPARRISPAPRPARRDVEQLGGGGVGHLRADLAGQPVGQQVGDEQQRRAAASSCGVPRRGGQLVDGVERQLLDPGDRVQLRGRDPGCSRRRRTPRSGCRGSAPGCRAARRRASSRP